MNLKIHFILLSVLQKYTKYKCFYEIHTYISQGLSERFLLYPIDYPRLPVLMIV